MADISAAQVKALRERTGLGMMECKKALVEAAGDMELAIDNLRKSSGLKAAKRLGVWPQMALFVSLSGTDREL